MNDQRLNTLRSRLREERLDALFISNPKNVRYVTGVRPMMLDFVQPFSDPEYFALVQQDRVDLMCDGRYISGVKDVPGVSPQLLEAPLNPGVIGKKILELLAAGAKTVGFERDSLLHGDALGLLEATDGIDWRGADDLVVQMRVAKSSEECDHVRQAQAITGQCFEHIAGFIKPGMTEYEVAREIENFMRDNSEGNSFHPIVAFGETGCRPHYTPSAERRLEKGQLVLLDFGAIHKGYCGDMTRMICMGKADARQGEVYELVLAAQLRCLDGVKPGVTTGWLDALCRDYLVEKGVGEQFSHGTGHGVGLAIHEEPRLKQNFDTITEPGMIFSVEPGLYYEGWGGVRIEDLVIVTADGHENITPTSKDLLELDV